MIETVVILTIVFVLAKVAQMSLMVRLQLRRLEDVLAQGEQLTAVERAAAILYDAMPLDERVRLAAACAAVGQMTLDEVQQRLDAILRTKKTGRAAPSGTLALIEAMEAEVAQPQTYHAVQLPSGWAVAYIDAQGDEAIACVSIDELDARRQALAKNITRQGYERTMQAFEGR